VITSRTRWVDNAAWIEEMRSTYREWWENLRETPRLEDLGIDDRILNLIFNMWDKGWEGLD
jgi:hypothetical protein